MQGIHLTRAWMNPMIVHRYDKAVAAERLQEAQKQLQQ
jgi:hypothetical protein